VAGALLFGLLFGQGTLLAAASGFGSSGTVETIAVRGAVRLTPAEVAAATGVVPGAPLATVDPRAVAEQLEDHDWIAQARAMRLPGGSLVVEVVERAPLASIDVGSPPARFAVDASGAPFAPATAQELEDLPRLVPAAEVTPRESSERLAEAVRVAHRLPDLGLALPTEVTIAAEDDPEGMTFQLAALPARFVMGRDDLDARLDDLVRLLAADPNGVAEAERVDLRFADQVVLRKKPTSRGSAQAAAARGGARSSTTRPSG
jgi:cell division protein FtsQ